jgi:hypothetical protein
MMHEARSDETRRALLCLLPALIAVARDLPAQDASKVLPQNYRVVLENAKLRVLEFNSRPGMGVCGSGWHSHPAHLTVLLSDAAVRVTTPDGKVQQRSGVPLGETFWSEAETHIVENVSGNNIRSLIIELKESHA